MAATYNGLLVINVYAASGTARRTDRESFYNCELTCLLEAASHNVILEGDFNCVLHPADTTLLNEHLLRHVIYILLQRVNYW